MLPVASVEALAGRGLEGDRHARAGSQRQVLLVEQEALDRLGLAPGTIREQVTVRGLELDALAEGDVLRLGSTRLVVAGPCDPCARMDEIRPGLRTLLEGRRGRFVSVLQGGSFAVGDPVEIEPAGS
jgi:MOSC domain-containing protein YiiM